MKIKRRQNPICVDCGKKLTSHYILRCRDCWVRFVIGKNATYYKHGRTCKDYKNYCIDCGKKIDYRSKRCIQCQGKILSRQRQGKNSPSWKGGLNKQGYHYLFPIMAKIIRLRDNFECQECGMTQEEHRFKYKNRPLEAHHINYNKGDCNPGNLITLCKKCNCRANFNRDYWYAYYTYKIEEKYSWDNSSNATDAESFTYVIT